MEKSVLDAAVLKYGEYADSGFKTSQVWAEVKKDPAKFKNDDVDEIVDAIYARKASAAPALAEVKTPFDEEDDTEDEPALGPEKPVAKTTMGLNIQFQEWRVDAKREEVRDEFGNKRGVSIAGFEKLKKTRVTWITQERADELNSQSANSGLRYYTMDVTADQDEVL